MSSSSIAEPDDGLHPFVHKRSASDLPIGISQEVAVHTFRQHDDVCWSRSGEPYPVVCPCLTVLVWVCRVCDLPVYMIASPGRWCEHLAWMFERGTPLQWWTTS